MKVILQIKICSDIFDKSKVILKPYGFSDILFAKKLAKQITLCEAYYNCEAIKLAAKAKKNCRVSLRTLG